MIDQENAMRFRHLIGLVFLAATLALGGCGGGGGDSSFSDPNDLDITLHADTTQLPVQSRNQFVHPYSELYTTNVWAEVSRKNGDPLPNATEVQFTVVGGKTQTGALYPSDLEEENEDGTPAAFWSWSEESGGGIARLIFHAWQQTGTVTIRAAVTDPDTGRQSFEEIEITVGSETATGLPAAVTTRLDSGPVYVANQGKNDTARMEVFVRDPSGQTVDDPSSANVKIELLNPEIGATLVGSNGERGSIVYTRTTRGKAQATMLAGNTTGSAKIRVTADAEDNNVDNGIQEPVKDDVTVTISDGRAASVTLTGPFVDAITDNQTILAVQPDESFQNGTYMRVVSALVKDHLGNPVVGEEVRFDLVDSPVAGYPEETIDFSPALPPEEDPAGGVTFAMSGDAGDPTEGGNLFDADDGGLVDYGASANDRVVLHPEEAGLDRALIGSRTISEVLDNDRLLVTAPFDANGGRDGGAIIPWTAGRAQYGAVGATATTDSQGVATTFLTYPMTRLNQPAMITATTSNEVADVMRVSYLGMGTASLTASLTEVPAGQATPVTLCVRDTNGAPLQTDFTWTGVPSSVEVERIESEDDPLGCSTYEIDATGYSGTADIPLVASDAATGLQTTITVKGAGAGTLFVNNITTDSSQAVIEVVLEDAFGDPLPGRQVEASGTANETGLTPSTTPAGVVASISAITISGGGETDSQGEATITVDYTGDPGDDTTTPPTPADNYQIDIQAQGGATKSVNFPYPQP